MDRKQWLETFLELADKGAPTLEYRKRLRIKVNPLRDHIKNIGSYRKELQDIKDEEERTREKARKADAARKRRLESRLQKRDSDVDSKVRWEDDGGAIHEDS